MRQPSSLLLSLNHDLARTDIQPLKHPTSFPDSCRQRQAEGRRRGWKWLISGDSGRVGRSGVTNPGAVVVPTTVASKLVELFAQVDEKEHHDDRTSEDDSCGCRRAGR
jgi:hypothetical protein